MKFDPTKPVQTRNGCKAKILSHDFLGDQPIIAIIEDEEGHQEIETFSNDGSYYTDEHYYHYHNDEKCEMDLINVPEQKKIDIHWGGIYKTKFGNFCICIDPDEYLNHPDKIFVRVLMCTNGKNILGLSISKILEHVGEINELGKYLNYMNAFQ